MTELPMFPLGTVLLPHMGLPLVVFEPRYRVLMDELVDPTGAPAGGFGVVLIARGHEVGGGDERRNVATSARILRAERLDDGRWLVLAEGTHRVRVERWLPDDPYPCAVVTDLVDHHDDVEVARSAEALLPKLRRVLALRRELGEDVVPGDQLDRSSSPEIACWQLPALASLTPLDTQRLLEIDDCGARLALLDELLDDAAASLTFRLRGGTR